MIRFADATEQSGIDYQSQSYGSYWGDFNGDGWTDLWVSNHLGNAAPNLYINQQDGTFVQSETIPPPINPRGDKGDFHAAAWADFDNDNDQDLIQLTGGFTEMDHLNSEIIVYMLMKMVTSLISPLNSAC